jgi:translation initiation factor RLI1
MFDYKLISENVQEMGMTQLAHNQFFVKNQEAWYRDFDREISCRDLVREIARKNRETLEIELDERFFTDDDYFDEEILEWIQYGTDHLFGVVGMYYTAMWGMAEIREWYKESKKSD